MKHKKLILFPILLGNAFEVYNFILFGVFSVTLAKVFFPSNDPFYSFLGSLGAFSASFLSRPLGAAFFGYIGDTLGRKNALILSMSLGSIPMLLIGITPSYETIGIFAPCFVILMRLIQGLTYGGECSGVGIFMLEHLSSQKTRFFSGLLGGIISSSSNIGVLTAILMCKSVFYFENISWIWRIPFIFGALIGFVSFYMRFKTTETPEFQEMNIHSRKHISFTQILKSYPKSSLACFFMGALLPCLSYSSIGFLKIYMAKYSNIPPDQTINFYLYGVVLVIITCPIFGLIGDYCDRRGYFAMAILGIFVSTPLAFYLLQEKTNLSMTLAHLLIALSYSSIYGPYHAFLQRLFPAEVRYRGISISYCAGGATIASIAPMIMLFIIEKTGNLNIPVFFICANALFLLIAIINLGTISYEPKKLDELFQKTL